MKAIGQDRYGSPDRLELRDAEQREHARGKLVITV